jgi:hypothetical protein
MAWVGFEPTIPEFERAMTVLYIINASEYKLRVVGKMLDNMVHNNKRTLFYCVHVFLLNCILKQRPSDVVPVRMLWDYSWVLRNPLSDVSSEAVTTVNVKSAVFWDMTPSSHVNLYAPFGGTYCPNVLIFRTEEYHGSSDKTFVPKRRYRSARTHGVISQTTAIFFFISEMKISFPTQRNIYIRIDRQYGGTYPDFG